LIEEDAILLHTSRGLDPSIVVIIAKEIIILWNIIESDDIGSIRETDGMVKEWRGNESSFNKERIRGGGGTFGLGDGVMRRALPTVRN
jgi:hypothetical protein